MNDFLDKDYKVPPPPSSYMDLEEGANTFRVLSSAITGWVYWTEGAEGKRQPNRVKTIEEVPSEMWKRKDDKPKHFWAFVVYNRQSNSVQILELTQGTIQRPIQDLVANPKWGDPKGYDIVVTKKRTGTQAWDIEYTVMPEPKEAVDPGIVKTYEDMKINLPALYEGGDPFAEADDKVNPDEVDRGIRSKNAA